MSSSQPGPAPRRRRIAGERRGATNAPEVVRGGDSGHVTETSHPPPSVPPPPVPSGDDSSVPGKGRVSLLKRRQSFGTTPRPAATSDRVGTRGGRAVAGGRRLVLGLAALLVVLLVYLALMLLGLLGTAGVADLDRADAEAAASRAAQSSAERAAEAVLAYDYRTLEEDRDAATRFMTEAYAKDYVGTFDTAVVDVAREAKAQVTVEVKGSAVLTVSVDRVRVLLFVDQATLSNASPQPRLAVNRVEFQMVKQGDSWVVDDVLSF